MIKLYSRFRFSDTKVVILQNHQKVMLKKITLILTLLCMLVLTATGANRRFTLVIDPGHGGHDAGALGAISKEKNINLSVALQFGKYVMQHPAFISGNFDTKFIEKHYNPDQLKPNYEHADVAALAAGTLFTNSKKQQQASTNNETSANNNWLKNRKQF